MNSTSSQLMVISLSSTNHTSQHQTQRTPVLVEICLSLVPRTPYSLGLLLPPLAPAPQSPLLVPLPLPDSSVRSVAQAFCFSIRLSNPVTEYTYTHGFTYDFHICNFYNYIPCMDLSLSTRSTYFATCLQTKYWFQSPKPSPSQEMTSHSTQMIRQETYKENSNFLASLLTLLSFIYNIRESCWLHCLFLTTSHQLHSNNWRSSHCDPSWGSMNSFCCQQSHRVMLNRENHNFTKEIKVL